ncbi:zeta toxin family protein [Nocardia sp. NPDC050710]|uniref:zeta toxin family protein n=1 Tax=Nocardia sp. NPDC050710 TaxID=3157220 RepID=UPI00340A5416
MTSSSGPSESSLLPDDRARQIFDDYIVPVLFADVFTHPQPRVTIVVGEPGSGTPTLARLLKKRDRVAPLMIVGIEDLRPFYPEYLQLPPELVMATTSGDAHRWLDMALDYLHGIGAGVIVDDETGSARFAARVAHKFAAARDGPAYTVEVALDAASSGASRLAELEADQLSRDRLDGGTYRGDNLLDQCRAGVLDVADWADTDPAVSTVSVHRGTDTTDVARRHRLPTGGWRHDPPPLRLSPLRPDTLSTRGLVKAVRELGLTLEESQAWLRIHDSLAVRMDPGMRSSLAIARAEFESVLFPPVLDSYSTLPAVTFGRYQVVTAWHMDAVVDMLRHYKHVTIGVFDPDQVPAEPFQPPPGLVPFCDDRNRAAAPELNPMSAGEQIAMWNAALKAAELQHRVTVVPIARPELDPDAFNRRFREFAVILPDARVYGEPDTGQHYAYWQILNRPIAAADPPLEYHGADIRRMFLDNNDAWQNLLPRGAREAFIAAQGHERLFRQAPIEAIQFRSRSVSSAVSAHFTAMIDGAFTEIETGDRARTRTHPNRRATDPFDIASTLQAAFPRGDPHWPTSAPHIDPAPGQISGPGPSPPGSEPALE